MILKAFAILIVQLIVCNADVSHIDTDLREDGYHYRQPSSPFSSDNKVDATLKRYEPENASEEKTPFQLGPMSIMKSQIKPQYLPPVEIQRDLQIIPLQKPVTETSHGFALPSQPTESYSTTFTSQLPHMLVPVSSPKMEPTRQQAPSQPFLMAQSSSIDLRPTPNTATTLAREYLPPDENEINLRPEQGQFHPALQQAMKTPSFSNPEIKYLSPTTQSTYSAPEMAITKKEPATRVQTDQVNYAEAKAMKPSAKPMFETPQYTYPEEQSSSSGPIMQPTYSTLGLNSRNPSLEPVNPDPAHELGPDGYKYKIPSQSFKY